jgi:hypothetical protein
MACQVTAVVPGWASDSRTILVSSPTSVFVGADSFAVDEVVELAAQEDREQFALDWRSKLEELAANDSGIVRAVVVGGGSRAIAESLACAFLAQGSSTKPVEFGDVRSWAFALRCRRVLVLQTNDARAADCLFASIAGDPLAAAFVCLSGRETDGGGDAVNAQLIRSALAARRVRVAVDEPRPDERLHQMLQEAQEQVATADEEREVLEQHAETLQALLNKERAEFQAALGAERTRVDTQRESAAAQTEARQRLERELAEKQRAASELVSTSREQAQVMAQAVKERSGEIEVLVRQLEAATNRADAATASVEAAKADVKQRWQKELSLVGEFQRKEREWQLALVEANDEGAKLRHELSRIQGLMQRQLAVYSRAAEAAALERQVDDELLDRVTQKLRETSPPRSRSAAQRVAILSPPLDLPTAEAPSAPATPTLHARTLVF